jgi:thiol-disulfide isomerase/thioredoxin
VTTLFGSLLLAAAGLPPDLLRDIGVVVLLVVGLGQLWPWLGELLERPFARLPGRQVNPRGNGLVLGLGLGLLFVPCAGPVLAVIAVVGASQRFSPGVLALALGFAVGVGVPLLSVALAGESLSRRAGVLRRRAPVFRSIGGAVMMVMALLIGLGATDGLQRLVPGYTEALQRTVEGSPAAADRLRALAAPAPTPQAGASATPTPTAAGAGECTEGASDPVDCGKAPELAGITGWLNTPGNAALTLAALRGKVVLIDFWTYSCINCQRTLPHVEAWYKNYRDAGFVVIGVHTPEFAFEHVTGNISSASHELGVGYPIAIDNNYGTWNAYGNQYWPAEYLIDRSGVVRHIKFGEGGYEDTENLIRQLLRGEDTSTGLPPNTGLDDATPVDTSTPETYLGFQHAPLSVSGTAPAPGKSMAYTFPKVVNQDTFALAGNWTPRADSLVSGPGARLRLKYAAKTVYLVLGGAGDVGVSVDGRPAPPVVVSGEPKLYTVTSAATASSRLVDLTFPPGVNAYSFTFG